jgi:hypothetical protein
MTTIERETIRAVAFSAAKEGIDVCDALIFSADMLALLRAGSLTTLELIRVAEEDYDWMKEKIRASSAY